MSKLLDHNGNWNLTRLNRFFFLVDVQAICRIRPSPRFGEDFIAWEPEKNGQFTVRSAYWLATGELYDPSLASTSNAHDGHRDVWSLIWSCPAPPKVLSFAWHAATNSLTTWKNKQRRTLETRGTCPVCGREDEDIFHVFCACDNARRLW